MPSGASRNRRPPPRKSDQAVIFDTGSTVHSLALHMPDHVTNLRATYPGLGIAQHLLTVEGVRTFLVGGWVDEALAETIGTPRDQGISDLRVHTLFLGAISSKVLPLDKVEVIITDSGIDKSLRERLVAEVSVIVQERRHDDAGGRPRHGRSSTFRPVRATLAAGRPRSRRERPRR
ncbi:DeoR/GlpR family DNA-binding transcription regulator [Amycolatopsis thermoflava]|uniref:hypothetical protein n=1 Tax=Amycolatopsis thermoflava TaxID=84480 RepID=UPI0038154CEA